ncbi:MAG TPA: hypothetical protein VGF50_00540 [Caulobacteraceae bacterium]|jgi:hypothetical protein
MSSWLLRILITSGAMALAAGLGFSAGPVLRWGRQLSDDYGDGFVVIVALMTMLVLISIVRMPLSHAHSTRRRRR